MAHIRHLPCLGSGCMKGMRTPPRLSSNSPFSLSLSLTPLLQQGTAKARLSDREIVLNATSWLPSWAPFPPLYSFAPSISFLSPIYQRHQTTLRLLVAVPSPLFHPDCCSTTPWNIVPIAATERIATKRNGWSTRG